MRKSSLTCFGVGDGWPSADHAHSSYLYQFEGAAFLIDCGEPISRTFKASHLSYDLIDRLFLSHLHFDHAGGFFMFMQSLWLEGRTKNLPVHCPADGILPLQMTLQAACIFPELLSFRLTFQKLRAKRAVQLGPVRVTPFPTTHLARAQTAFQRKYPQAFAAFAFLIEAPACRAAHSADIGAAEDLLPLLGKPLDLLVCELAHVPVEELFLFLRGRPIRQIAFVHLSRECRQELPRLRAAAKKLLRPIQVIFPEDGDDIPLE